MSALIYKGVYMFMNHSSTSKDFGFDETKESLVKTVSLTVWASFEVYWYCTILVYSLLYHMFDKNELKVDVFFERSLGVRCNKREG